MAWQRVLSLQVLRWLVSDPQVLYILFSTYDMSIDCDRNPINEIAYAACEVIRVRDGQLLAVVCVHAFFGGQTAGSTALIAIIN